MDAADTTDVGVRELRSHLSRYLDRVKRGEELTITERGVPIARIVPARRRPVLDQLVAEGLVTPPTHPDGWRPETRIAATGSVSDLVIEQRR